MSEVAACVRCTNQVCSVVVILPAIPDGDRRLDKQNESMEIDCPACRRLLAISFKEIFLYEVTDDDLLAGYIAQ